MKQQYTNWYQFVLPVQKLIQQKNPIDFQKQYYTDLVFGSRSYNSLKDSRQRQSRFNYFHSLMSLKLTLRKRKKKLYCSQHL